MIPCTCVIKNRLEEESQRDWLKRWMCMYHWVQTDYYKEKLAKIEAKISEIQKDDNYS